MSNSVRPHRPQPTRLPHPWDSPGKSTGVGCHCLLQCMKVKSESEVARSCQTLSDPMDCSPPGSSVHGIFQARVLEWGASAFSNIYTTICKIDSQWEFALWCMELKPSNLWHPWGNLWQPWGVGWGGRLEGGSRGKGHMYTYGWFMLIYGRNNTICKAIMFQLKINKL